MVAESAVGQCMGQSAGRLDAAVMATATASIPARTLRDDLAERTIAQTLVMAQRINPR